MRKEYVGIYLGKDFVSAVKTEGKNLVSFSKVNLSSLREDSSNGIIQENVLWEALVSKALKEIDSEHNDVFVSLEDKEFIFRSFDMPLISKKEIKSSLNYEIEKYIPFKMEELVWDYSYVKIPKYKKLNLAFVGIKDITYKRYKTLFTNTDINVLNVEPSAISLARVLKSLKFTKKVNDFAILDFSEDASYITFFYNDLPIFNRFLGPYKKKEDETAAVDKLIEEVRISIQYFSREFKSYNLSNLFILCNPDSAKLLSLLKDKIGIESEVITAEQILNKKGVELEHFKAYSAATVSLLPSRFKPIFQSKDDLASFKNKIAVGIPSLNYILLGSVLVVGIVGCILLYSVLNNNLSARNYKIKQRIEKLALPDSVKGKSIDGIEEYIKNRIDKNNSLINKIKADLTVQDPLYPMLDALPGILTEGLWLSDFRLRRDKNGSLKLMISGYVLLLGEEKGRSGIDKFIVALKNSNSFHHCFSRIDLISMGRSKIKNYNVLSFSLKLE